MAKKPAISVLMTFYDNGKAEPRKYLEESLHSILNQSFRDFEIVLVVSGKRDFARRLARKSRKIRLFFFKQKVVLADQPELERRKGIVRGRNECIRNARGDIVAFADADDICLPERLERQYRFMKTNRDIGAIGSSLIHIDNGGGRICVRGARENDMDIRRGLLSFCSLYQTTMMVRKELLLKAGGYRTTRFAEDYDLLVRLARLTKFHNIVEPLVMYRVFSGRASLNRKKYIIGDIPIKLEALRTLGVFPTPKELAYNLVLLASLLLPLNWKRENLERIRCIVENALLGLNSSYP